MVEVRVTPMDLGTVALTVSHAGTLADGGSAVVLLHGFPEIGYSWRHQIPVLADAGHRVLAPDQRGYGWSDAPPEVTDYAITELVGDVIALLDREAIDEAVIVGHDWGAIVAPWVALFRPERVRGLALLSVPYTPRGDQSVIEHLRETDPEGPFAYMLAFQEPGIEELFEADPLETLRRFHWAVCGARPKDFVRGDELPEGLPPHLSQGEFENYYRAFARSGFGNPINWYRNLHRNWELTRAWHNAPLTCPTTFIAGTRDFVVTGPDGTPSPALAGLEHACADLRGVHLIDGAGHWIQQEAPDKVNSLLLDFIEAL